MMLEMTLMEKIEGIKCSFSWELGGVRCVFFQLFVSFTALLTLKLVFFVFRSRLLLSE